MVTPMLMKFFALILLCFSLSGCFVPHKYYAVLTLTEKQYFFDFIGEMRIMALYTDAGKDASVDKKHAQQQILSEFSRVIQERNPSRFELRVVEDTVFQTRYTYASPYTYPEASGLFNFHLQDNILTVTSRHISPEERKLLQKNNIPSSGTLCIKTYGKIIENNAHKPANILQQCSTWDMENLDESVKMVIRFANSLDVP